MKANTYEYSAKMLLLHISYNASLSPDSIHIGGLVHLV